ncbi:MAG: LytTR family DNA-binding domain-containing protein [Leptospiraceae bacterium]|nr:LytTR family DNA-binding domain-containing protein [Leptospiraceae bacterium]
MSQYTYSVLIVEDESSGLDLLIDYVSSHNKLKLSGIARNGNDALDKIQSRDYDIIFLDILLPGKTGMEILRSLEKVPVIIFTTAYKEHALEAFDIGVTDYLLKPFSLNRFQQSVERAIERIKANNKMKPTINSVGLFLRAKEKRIFIPYDQIIYITANAKHCIVHKVNEDLEVTHMIGELEEKLPKTNFNRIHRKFIVNLKFVKHMEFEVGGQHVLSLNDEAKTSLPVGRTYIDELKDL